MSVEMSPRRRRKRMKDRRAPTRSLAGAASGASAPAVQGAREGLRVETVEAKPPPTEPQAEIGDESERRSNGVSPIVLLDQPLSESIDMCTKGGNSIPGQWKRCCKRG